MDVLVTGSSAYKKWFRWLCHTYETYVEHCDIHFECLLSNLTNIFDLQLLTESITAFVFSDTQSLHCNSIPAGWYDLFEFQWEAPTLILGGIEAAVLQCLCTPTGKPEDQSQSLESRGLERGLLLQSWSRQWLYWCVNILCAIALAACLSGIKELLHKLYHASVITQHGPTMSNRRYCIAVVNCPLLSFYETVNRFCRFLWVNTPTMEKGDPFLFIFYFLLLSSLLLSSTSL